jgi:hypothetical protein
MTNNKNMVKRVKNQNHTFIVQVFFIITCSFSVFVENCILLPKGINKFVVFLCIVHVWFETKEVTRIAGYSKRAASLF